MAKRRRKNVHFHEALSAAPRLIPGNMPLGETADAAWRRANRNFRNLPWGRWRNDAGAGLHDLGHQTRRVWRAATGLRSRIVVVSLLLAGVVIGLITAAETAVSTVQTYSHSLSNPITIMNTKNTGTTILDRNGVVLFQGYGAVSRHIIPFVEMPQSLKQATLATEDPDFYKHPGFSWRGTVRAAYQDVLHTGTVQGGSTITQQLVKNTMLSNEKSFNRKYKEIVLSLEMEQHYSKDQILQMYLNTIYYGQGAYGVESAAETYFHKPAKDLTVDESALLAGLPQSPSRFDPNFDLAASKDRRDYVLDRMHEQGYLTAEETKDIQAKPVVAGTREAQVKAPHFVFYVLDQLRAQYGEDTIEHGGITVHTSLDYTRQQQAQQIVSDQVNRLADHHVSNGGLVSIDPHTGDILAMVGSTDYNAPGFGNVNVTLSQLQPGSSFKPIAYATAFTKGWNGATKVDDKPLRLPSGDGTIYAPQDYDQKWRGPVTLRRALSNSLNIPAIEVLQYAGLTDTIIMAHNLGISGDSLNQPNRYGLSLVLGGGEVRPIDMAAVYSALANQGKSVAPRAIIRVSNKFGDDVTKPSPSTSHQALDPRITYMLTNILSDTKSRQEEFGVKNPLQLSRPAAAKTGTTNDFRDNWTVGYTPDLVTAVWVGNNDHSPMNNVDGITGAAPIWHDFMETALAGTPVHDFVMPAGLVTAKVCNTDGGLADPADPNGVTEVFLTESPQTKHCGWAGGSPGFKLLPTQPTGLPTQNPVDQPNQSPGQGGASPGSNPGPDSLPPTDTTFQQDQTAPTQ